jgi:hypothetical protein
MQEMVHLSTQLHLIFIFLLIALIVANIYLLKKEMAFGRLSKRLELLAPQYYIVLSAIFFTGLIVMAVQQFSFSWLVWGMIVAWMFLLFFGIQGHKRYKQLKRYEVEPLSYKAFALRNYVIDMGIIFLILALYYGVH